MKLPRYLLVKYVPDPGRMEPRNVGLVLWHKGKLLARFLDVQHAKFVLNKSTFGSRISEFTDLIGGDKISVPGQKPIPKSDEACLDALTSIQDEEYLFVDSGYVPDNIPAKDISKATDFLFRELVSISGTAERSATERSRNLAVRCDTILQRTGIAAREDFRRTYPVDCLVYGVVRPLHFSYGLGNGDPAALMQRVTLPKEQSVNSAALMFGSLIGEGILDKGRCGALVQTSDINGKAAEQAHKFLETLCVVIDVDMRDAEARINSLASSGKSQGA